MTLLTAIQECSSLLGLRQPAAVFGSSDQTAQTLLACAQQGAARILTYHEWSALVTEKTFTTVAALAQTNSIPTDFDRFVYNVEVWNRSLTLRYVGPTPQRVWQRLRVGVGGGVIGYWRKLGSAINIQPAPIAGQTVAYEYVSRNICSSAAGVGQPAFQADTDLFPIGEDLLKLEIIWRFKYPRGFAAYAEDLQNAGIELEKAAANDRGMGRVRPSNQQSGDPIQPSFDGTLG